MPAPTDGYLTHNLIPYIGNKRKLVDLLREVIAATGVEGGTFVDLFAGSGAVSRLAKTMGFRVIANDWEPYSETLNGCYVGLNRPPRFSKLGGLDGAIDILNGLKPKAGYIAGHYCPADDEAPDVERERMFYTQANGRRIDAIREQIALWRDDGTISAAEECALLAPLVFQGAYCSNTSGVFKGFHRGWGGATSTALYRIRSSLALWKPVFCDNGRRNEVVREDANELCREIEGDVIYIDPPYNVHQYGSNYHLLNTIVLWDKPPLSRTFRDNGRVKDKSAIRRDWRTERRSRYCYARSATDAFAELVERVRGRHILVSYSTDGLVPYAELIEMLSTRGRLTCFVRKYVRYRVSSQRPSPRPHNVEFVLSVDTSEPGGRASAGRVKRQIEEVQQNIDEEGTEAQRHIAGEELKTEN